ncbi:MAG: hypothetical protein FWC91_01105 [Defluviitaleaceae bacterium]|nr:hypothetical protein [Defluviitaleaceae bacterium]
MTDFESLEGFDAEDSAISMFDEDGTETGYRMLATKREGDCLYMLAEEEVEESDDPVAEVLIFKCITSKEGEEVNEEELVFELVDEEHESFELAFSLFKEDFDALGIGY